MLLPVTLLLFLLAFITVLRLISYKAFSGVFKERTAAYLKCFTAVNCGFLVILLGLYLLIGD